MAADPPMRQPGFSSPRLLALARRLGRPALAVLQGYRGESLALRAGNLTFVTITSLVPLAAVVFSLVHQLGGDRVDALLKRLMADVLSPGGEQTLRALFAAASSRTAGGLSFLLVMVSAGVLLRHLDASLNEVWAVRRRRPLLVSLAVYAGVLLVGPLLIVVTLVGSDGARRLVDWLDLPFSAQAYGLAAAGAVVLLFSFLYKFAPQAPVPWRSALIGGATAGLVWELARHLYGGLAGLLLKGGMVYGSLGVAPLFLMWVYLGWYIFLSGARLAYAVEHADFHDEFASLVEHPRSHELVASRIAELVTASVLSGGPGLSTRALAVQLSMPEQRVADLAQRLLDAGLLVRAPTGALAPSRDPAELSLADVSAAVGGTAGLLARERTSRTGQFDSVARVFTQADEVTVQKLKGISWLRLATEPREEAPKP